MNNEALRESTPVGTVVYTLKGYDPEGGNVTFGLIDSGNFMVDPVTGQVRIVKALDREVGVLCRKFPDAANSADRHLITGREVQIFNCYCTIFHFISAFSARTRSSFWCPLRTESTRLGTRTMTMSS